MPATIKVQSNIEKDVGEHVNKLFKSMGLTPTSAINLFYHKVNQTGTIPFQIGVTQSQRDAMELHEVSNHGPVYKVRSAQDWDKFWDDVDNG